MATIGHYGGFNYSFCAYDTSYASNVTHTRQQNEYDVTQPAFPRGVVREKESNIILEDVEEDIEKDILINALIFGNNKIEELVPKIPWNFNEEKKWNRYHASVRQQNKSDTIFKALAPVSEYLPGIAISIDERAPIYHVTVSPPNNTAIFLDLGSVTITQESETIIDKLNVNVVEELDDILAKHISNDQFTDLEMINLPLIDQFLQDVTSQHQPTDGNDGGGDAAKGSQSGNNKDNNSGTSGSGDDGNGNGNGGDGDGDDDDDDDDDGDGNNNNNLVSTANSVESKDEEECKDEKDKIIEKQKRLISEQSMLIQQQSELIKQALLDSQQQLVSKIQSLIITTDQPHTQSVNKKSKNNKSKNNKSKKNKSKKINDGASYHPMESIRAKNNIYIPRIMTDKLISNRIKEQFSDLYREMDIVTALQFNDETTNYVYNATMIKVLNYGFHDKKTNEPLYCMIREVDESKEENKTKSWAKWVMMNKLFTDKEIQSFGIDSLPKSPRLSSRFISQLEESKYIKILIKNTTETTKLIKQTAWHKMKVFSKAENKRRMTLSLTKPEFIKQFKHFMANIDCNNINLFPILMFNKNGDWSIDHVLIVTILKYWNVNINIGISLKYDEENNTIKATGIHLEKNDIYKQHISILPQHTCQCLDNFEFTINDLQIGNPDDNINRINALKIENQILKTKISLNT